VGIGSIEKNSQKQKGKQEKKEEVFGVILIFGDI
jgi:hypothetical protein